MEPGRRTVLRWLSATSLLALDPALARAGAAPPPLYKDPRAPVALRVRDLLARMTLDEKVAQLITLSGTKRDVQDADGRFDPARAAAAYPHGFGQVARPSERGRAATAAETGAEPGARWHTPAQTIAWVNAAQGWARDGTRLGIPILCHEEALHGYMAPDATSFPQAIALAGSFDRDLMTRVQRVIGREARAHGAALVLSPVVDIARDPRWGRIEETFGEDPYLCAEMGVAAITGIQGGTGLPAAGHPFATLKHMTGHGQPESGENTAPAPLGERELRSFFFPPFRAAVTRTGVGAVMPSYNEIDGVPSHANRWLLGRVLRGEWGFDGAIVSDYAAIPELATRHGVAADLPGAAALAIAAGVDCDLPDGEAYRTLAASVRAGRVPQTAVDAACAHMLTLKFRAGLFEAPRLDAAAAAALTGDAAARALALEAAQRSICLLRNDGLLPLTPGAHKRVAVIGPNAAIARLGGYSSIPKQTVSLLDGVRARLGNQAEVVHAQGVHITRSEDRNANAVELADPAQNRRLIAEAVAVARGADLVILAIGDTEQTSREGYAVTHLGDRTSLDLVGEQNALFAALHATGKPMAVVAINGRPPSWPAVVAEARALLECWYPGQEGGTAMAGALFGDSNPGAKLPVSVARHVGQLPVFYDAKPTARRGYLFDTTEPLFPFGFGLSYTRFALGPPHLSAARIRAGDPLTVTVQVRNTGERAGDEVVQLYVRDRVASVTTPVKALKGFARVTLAPGEARDVTFGLGRDAFTLWNGAMEEVIEPGLFDIMTGPDSRDLQTAVLEIV